MEKEIGKIPKNDTTEIVLRVDDFAEKRGLTIREFVTSERYTGFTKSGVRILAGEDFKRFKDMINSIPEEDMSGNVGSTSSESAGDSNDSKNNEESPEKGTESGQKDKANSELPDY